MSNVMRRHARGALKYGNRLYRVSMSARRRFARTTLGFRREFVCAIELEDCGSNCRRSWGGILTHTHLSLRISEMRGLVGRRLPSFSLRLTSSRLLPREFFRSRFLAAFRVSVPERMAKISKYRLRKGGDIHLRVSINMLNRIKSSHGK